MAIGQIETQNTTLDNSDVVEVEKLSFEDELKRNGLDISHFSPEEYESLKTRYLNNPRYKRSIDNNLDLVDATVDERKAVFIGTLERAETEEVAPIPEEALINMNPGEIAEKKIFEKIPFLSFLGGTGFGAGVLTWLHSVSKDIPVLGGLFGKWFGVQEEAAVHANNIKAEADTKAASLLEAATTETQDGENEVSTEDANTETPDSEGERGKDIPEAVEEIDTIENRKAAYTQLGKIIIKKIGGEIFEGDDNFNSTVDIMTEKGLTIENLRSYVPTDLELREKNISRENYEKATGAFVSSEMTIILESLFSIQNLQHLVSRPKAKEMIDELGIDITNTYPQNVKIDKLLILLPLTLSGFTYLSSNSAVNFAGSSMSRMVNFAQSIEFSKIKEDLSQDIEDFSEHIISQDIEGSSIFLSQDSNTLHFTEQQLADKGLDTENEQVKRFLAFKDFTINDVLKNPRYNLGMENEIINKFSLNDVFQLYVLFGGYLPEDISEIDSFKSSIIYTWVFSTLKRYDVQGAYGAKIQQELEQQEYIEEEDTALISVIVLRIIEESVNDIKIVIEKGLRAGFETVKANPAEAGLLALGLYAVNKIPAVRGARITHKLFLLGGGVGSYFYVKADKSQREHADEILAGNPEFEKMKQGLQQAPGARINGENSGDDNLRKAGEVIGSIVSPFMEGLNGRTK